MRLFLFSLVIIASAILLSTTASFTFAEDIERIARDNLNVQPTENSPSAENFPSLDDMSEEEIIKFLSSQQQHQQQQSGDIIIDADDQQAAHELHHHQQGGVNTNDAPLTLDDGVTPKQKVLVIGANGATGRLILEELVAAKKYLPIAMVRDPEQEHELINIPQLYGKIQTVIADLEYPMEWIFEDVHHNSPPPLVKTTTKKDGESSSDQSVQDRHRHHDIETVLFAAGSKGKNVANVDLAGGIRAFSTSQKFPYVKRFIMLSATNVRPDSQSAIKHYHRAKWYADEFIRDGDTFAQSEERSKTSSPLYWTIVCPSSLTNVDNDPEVIGKVDLGPEYWVDRENKNFAQETNGKGVYRPGAKSARRNVAKVMVAAIENEKTFKKTFRLLDGEDEIEDAFNKL